MKNIIKAFIPFILLISMITSCSQNAGVEAATSIPTENESPTEAAQETPEPITEAVSEEITSTSSETTTTLTTVTTTTTAIETEKSFSETFPLLECPVSENVRRVMSMEEAFENGKEIIADTQEGKSLPDIIQMLMNKNVIAFETYFPGRTVELVENNFISDIWGEGRYIYEVTSDYFVSFEKLEEFVYGTYTEQESHDIMYGSEKELDQLEYLLGPEGRETGGQQYLTNEDGKFCINYRATPRWSSDPFYLQSSYIKITEVNKDECYFNWYCPGYFEYRGYYEKRCLAIKENGQWKLTFLVFDNDINAGYWGIYTGDK